MYYCVDKVQEYNAQPHLECGKLEQYIRGWKSIRLRRPTDNHRMNGGMVYGEECEREERPLSVGCHDCGITMNGGFHIAW